MALTKVLVTVKTYPTISSKYEELVCTAGFLDDRPYSHDSEIKILGHIGTEHNWAERKKYVLGKIYYNLTDLIAEAHNKEICTSLAVFKPTKILDFTIEEVERERDKNKIAKLEAERQQFNLFKQPENPLEVVKKLPYKFSYVFEDNQGKESKLMIEDWEIGQLYWNCFARHEGNEQKAIADVRKKYFDDFAKTKDLHLFLGTSQLHHYRSHNPFMIIGTFHPKIETQGSLF